MTARILHFSMPQEPIRMAMPRVRPGFNWSPIAALALNFGIWIGIGIVAWRFL